GVFRSQSGDPLFVGALRAGRGAVSRAASEPPGDRPSCHERAKGVPRWAEAAPGSCAALPVGSCDANATASHSSYCSLRAALSRPAALSFALTPSDATPNPRQPPQLSLAWPAEEGRDESSPQSPVDRGLRRTRSRARDPRSPGD